MAEIAEASFAAGAMHKVRYRDRRDDTDDKDDDEKFDEGKAMLAVTSI
jgi:hypothetical protein